LSASHTDRTRSAATSAYHARSPERGAEGGERRHAHPVGAAGEAVLGGDDDRDDDSQAERRHREVVAFQAQDRAADRVGERRRERGRGGERRERRPAVARGEDRRAVGAHAEEARVAERDLAGVADQQVQADGDDRVQPDQDRDFVVVIVGEY